VSFNLFPAKPPFHFHQRRAIIAPHTLALALCTRFPLLVLSTKGHTSLPLTDCIVVYPPTKAFSFSPLFLFFWPRFYSLRVHSHGIAEVVRQFRDVERAVQPVIGGAAQRHHRVVLRVTLDVAAAQVDPFGKANFETLISHFRFQVLKPGAFKRQGQLNRTRSATELRRKLNVYSLTLTTRMRCLAAAPLPATGVSGTALECNSGQNLSTSPSNSSWRLLGSSA
jgi:hypothetical protein